MKPFYEYHELAQKEGLIFFNALPTDKRESLWRTIEAIYSPATCLQLKKAPDIDAHLLQNDILVYLLDFLPREEAVFLLKLEMQAKFSICLLSHRVADIEGLPEYYYHYLQRIASIDWHTQWFITQQYSFEDIQEVGEVERYFFLRKIEYAYRGYEADLAIIVPQKNKIQASLTKTVYQLAYLDITISLAAPIDKRKDTENHIIHIIYIEKCFTENKQHFFEKTAKLKGQFKEVLLSEIAHAELSLHHEQALAHTHQAVSGRDLQQYIANYQKIDKIKHQTVSKIELKMQGGTLYMQASSKIYWVRMLTWAFSFCCFGAGIAFGNIYLLIAVVSFYIPEIYAYIKKLLYEK